MSTATSSDTAADTSARPILHTYGRLAFGYSQSNYVQVLGLARGRPAAASMQNSTSVQGSWSPVYVPLAPVTLSDLVVCAGNNTTQAIGLGTDGNIYPVGKKISGGSWQAASGSPVTQSKKFKAGTLRFQLINTSTVFAVASDGGAWVATYRSQDAQPVWKPGYQLPQPTTSIFQSLAARPDLSDAGTTHAIALAGSGVAYEVATAKGPGVGVNNWTAGAGALGGGATLPTFSQLVLVSGDCNSTFHVIGLGTDGSVWDIDQFAVKGSTLGWSKKSKNIVPAGTITVGPIDFYLSNPAGSIVINLVKAVTGGLQVFAQFSQTGWNSASISIATSGGSTSWRLINNLVAGTGVLALGLGSTGFAYELAYFDGNTWTAGSRSPISG